MDEQACLAKLNKQMEHSLNFLNERLSQVRAGKASPAMLAGITVDYYGVPTPIEQVGNVTAPDARTIQIQPWEKKLLPEIEKAILAANIGLNPQNNGDTLRVPVPALTEERRKELVKQAKAEGETAKLGIRNARRDANDTLKKLQKEGLSEDEVRKALDKVQKVTDEFIAKIDARVNEKEKEIMTV